MRVRCYCKTMLLAASVLLLASVPAGHASIITPVGIGDGSATGTPTEYSYNPVCRGWLVGPVTANSDAAAGAWVKELDGPAHGWPRRGGTYNVYEILQVGTGASWSSWQEQILTSGWDWVKGSVYALSSGTGFNPASGAWNSFKGLSLLDTGDVTGASIKFDFGPVGIGTWLVFTKTLE